MHRVFNEKNQDKTQYIPIQNHINHIKKKKSDLEIGDMEIMMEDLLYYHSVDSCLSSDYPVWAESFPFQEEPSLHSSRISVIRFFYSLFTVKILLK